MASLRVLLCVLALTTVAVFAIDPLPYSATVTGTTVNGAYSSYPTSAVTTPGGLSGSVSVSVVGTLAVNTTVCFSAFPIFSPDLSDACPAGGLVTFSNITAATEVRFARKSFSAFSSTKRTNRFAAATQEVASQLITLQPSTTYYITYVAVEPVNATLTLELTGTLCPAGSVSTGSAQATCITPVVLPVDTPATVDAAPTSFTYFSVDPQAYNSSVGSVTFSLSNPPAAMLVSAEAAATAAPAGLSLFAQINALPTATSSATVIGTGSSITIENPSSIAGTLFIGVQNVNTMATSVTLGAAAKVCAANTYGNACRAIQWVSGALGSTTQKASKSSDSTNNLMVYQVDAGSIPATASIVRVSVSSSTQTSSDSIFARFGAPPTVTEYDYSVRSGYVNQLVLPVLTAGAADPTFNATWYVAVAAANDYVLWGGNNCANACNGWNTTSTNGQCSCNGQFCDVITTYQVPVFRDSFGVCQCKDTKKQNNFDCSALVETSSPFKTVYIVLIAVGGAIVLAVAIGVPVYCYLQNRKRDYERL